MRIDCDECVMQGTEACQDCVVTFLVRRTPARAVVLDLDEERALRRLAGAVSSPSSGTWPARRVERPAPSS